MNFLDTFRWRFHYMTKMLNVSTYKHRFSFMMMSLGLWALGRILDFKLGFISHKFFRFGRVNKVNKGGMHRVTSSYVIAKTVATTNDGRATFFIVESSFIIVHCMCLRNDIGRYSFNIKVMIGNCVYVEFILAILW